MPAAGRTHRSLQGSPSSAPPSPTPATVCTVRGDAPRPRVRRPATVCAGGVAERGRGEFQLWNFNAPGVSLSSTRKLFGSPLVCASGRLCMLGSRGHSTRRARGGGGSPSGVGYTPKRTPRAPEKPRLLAMAWAACGGGAAGVWGVQGQTGLPFAGAGLHHALGADGRAGTEQSTHPCKILRREGARASL